MDRMFGTDGVRGIANTELTAQLAFQLGAAATAGLTEGIRTPTILVGRDTRVSGEMLEFALISGILSRGGAAVRLGVLPTPGVAQLVRTMRADAGAVISASHNSYEHNGIKFFGRGGLKLPDEMEDKLEALATGGAPLPPAPTGGGVGTCLSSRKAAADYLAILRREATVDLAGLRVAIDCANGAASAIAPKLFAEMGARVFSSHHSPDGLNINERCGSTHLEALAAFTRDRAADVGIAFDGDADRMLACDENGAPIDGDRIMTLCALSMQRAGKLSKNTLVATVMSNAGMEAALRARGIALVRTGVGDRYVLERMLRDGYNLGGEQSGHVIFLDHSVTGDGMLTALKLLSALRESDAPVSVQAAAAFEELPQALFGARVTARQKSLWERDATITAEIARIREALGGEGRILVRASGTEALVRVLVEGRDLSAIERDAQVLCTMIESI